MKIRYYAILIILILGVLLRMLFMVFYPPASDEAFFGLTAKHISEFKEFPIFLHKNHYGGTLSCYIGAIFFKFFGVSLYTWRSITIIFLWLPFVLFSCLFSKKFRPWIHSLLVLTFLSLTPHLVTMLTSYLPGTYPESFAIGSIIFYLLAKLLVTEDYRKEKKLFLLISLLIGMGFWISPQVIYYLFTVFTLLWMKDRRFFLSRKIFLFVLFFSIGALPVIVYNLQYPAASFFRFSGRILHLENRSILASPDLLKIIISQILWRLSLIPIFFINSFKLIYQMATGSKIFSFWPNILFSPIGLLYFAALAFAVFRRGGLILNIINKKVAFKNIDGADICLIFVFWFLVIYAFAVGDVNNLDLKYNRFIAPVYIVFPFLLSDFLLWIKNYKKIIFLILTCSLILVNSLSSLQTLKIESPESPARYNKLVNFLISRNLIYGYSNEDIAYSLDFLTHENMIYTAALFSEFEERYPEYTKKVDSQERIGYIFNTLKNAQKRFIFERFLKARNIDFKKEEVYPFVVYYGLSELVRPQGIEFMP